MAKVWVTGAAGFIGAQVSKRLLDRGDAVLGLDNLSDYYDVRLKEARLDGLRAHPGFTFQRLDIADGAAVAEAFKAHPPERVIHLAAQVGVRYSLQNPEVYAQSNLVGFVHILEGCRKAQVQHLVFASSSSVYGGNTKLPYSTDDNVDHPVSLYAATKKANELMAHSYSHLYRIPTTGLRFFTVYGPWGRPDMAPMLFTRAILKDTPIDVFNFGKMRRDFTYVDDIVEGVLRVLDGPPSVEASSVPYRVYNIGNNTPVELLTFIDLLEKQLGKKAKVNLLPLQPGDVLETWADTSPLEREFGFKPSTPLETGLARMVEWYRPYYGL
jgi:UDP-glucuronate 4-epimerase